MSFLTMNCCFCIPTTTRNRIDKEKELELKTSLYKLNSIIQHYILPIYVGYDFDDEYYSVKENRDTFEYSNLNISWFEQKVEKGNVVEIWNNLGLEACKRYDYIMIIGDDIEYPNSIDWLYILMKKLKSTDNIGVAGGFSGNPNLPMTQFLVHSKHIDNLGYVFNPLLKNWFCDNYLCELYNKKYFHYVEDIKLLNIGGPPRYIPENHKELYKKLVKRDRPKLLNLFK